MDELIVAVSASVGQVVGTAVTFPLDVVKTKMQAAEKPMSTMEALQEAVEVNGVVGTAGLFPAKGFSAGMSRFTYYYIYTWLGNAYKKSFGVPTFFANMFLGYLTGLLNTVFLNPNEALASNVIFKNMSIADAITDIKGEEGWSNFYRGWEMTFLSSLNPAIQNSVFDRIKAHIIGAEKGNLGYWQAFWVGALSKAVATAVMYPAQRAKSIVQVNKQAGGAVEAVTKVIKKDGPMAMYQGLQPTLTKGVLQSAFMLMVKERIDLLIRIALKGSA